MKCPSCGSFRTYCRTTQRCTINSPEDALRRNRVCHECNHKWSTTERVDEWDRQTKSWKGHSPGPQLPPSSMTSKRSRSPKAAKPAAFYPVGMADAADILVGIPPTIAADFLEWWNSSRRSKHGPRAAWTRRAFIQSAQRVKDLPEWAQTLLVNAGIEHGWQALQSSYIQGALDKGPPGQGAGFRPQSQGLAGALSIIEGGRGHG